MRLVRACHVNVASEIDHMEMVSDHMEMVSAHLQIGSGHMIDP